MSDADLVNLTQCPVCKQTYTEPSQLPCRDTLCKKCFFSIEATAATSAAVEKDQQVRRCPVCSRECLASGSELKPDNRAAWIVRTRKASADRQQRENAKGRCSLPHCGESAISRGFYFEGTLCTSHVRTDEEKFAEIKQSAQSLLQLVRGLTQLRKDALADLQTERGDTSELFDAAEARLQRCRKQTLGRLDTAVDKLKLELRAVEFIEKLQIEIQDAERVGDLLLSSRLFKQLHLSLADVDVKAGWASSVDETVELAQHLLTTVDIMAADVETGKGAFVRSCMELREPVSQDVYTRGIAPLAATVCTRTDGFHFNAESGALTKQPPQIPGKQPPQGPGTQPPQGPGTQPLPPRCVVAFGKKEAGYFAAAPNPRELLAQYYDSFGKFCGQFSHELAPNATLAAVECASQLQLLFLLLNTAGGSADASSADASSAPAPPASPASSGSSACELTVLDLAGTQLQSVRDLQLGGGGCPARALTCCGDYLTSVCLYVLGAGGQLACVSLAADGACQLQECIQLQEEAKEARGVAASGRRLVLATPRSALLLSPVTKSVVRLLSVGEKDAELKRAVTLGCGFVAVADASRWLCFATRGGAGGGSGGGGGGSGGGSSSTAAASAVATAPRSHRGATEPACLGRVEFGNLRFYATRTGR